VDAKAFLRAKTLEMRQRHVKYEGTPYALEPNCKESPGGLRDLQVVIWVARAAGLGRTWAELAAKGLVTPFEVSQLHKHEGVLKLIRARLHMVAGGAKTGWCSTCRPPWPRASAEGRPRRAAPRC
jgi:[protein-PII] uridylyltransferase